LHKVEKDELIIPNHFWQVIYECVFLTCQIRKREVQATYYLPGALSAMLEGAGLEANAGVFKTSLFRLTRLLWGKEAMRRLLRSQPANFLGLLFLEYGLTVVAEKQPGVGVP